MSAMTKTSDGPAGMSIETMASLFCKMKKYMGMNWSIRGKHLKCTAFSPETIAFNMTVDHGRIQHCQQATVPNFASPPMEVETQKTMKKK